MTGAPQLPAVDGATGERRRDESKTDRHAALPRNVEEGQYRQQADKDGQQECVFWARLFVVVCAETFRAAQWGRRFMVPVTALNPTASVERQTPGPHYNHQPKSYCRIHELAASLAIPGHDPKP